MEWGDRGIRVNAINPGYTLAPDEYASPEVAEIPYWGELPLSKEMGGPAVFLPSPASSFCTDVNLLVDNGFVCE